jgi:hypothetical protein
MFWLIMRKLKAWGDSGLCILKGVSHKDKKLQEPTLDVTIPLILLRSYLTPDDLHQLDYPIDTIYRIEVVTFGPV